MSYKKIDKGLLISEMKKINQTMSQISPEDMFSLDP